MSLRHSLLVILFLALVAALVVGLDSRTTLSAAAEDEGLVPPEALAALRDGRFLRASLILREYLATATDSSPSAVLLAARAEAGWGDWDRVERLLAGRVWLDSVSAGRGWELLGRSQLALGRLREGSASLSRYLRIAGDDGRRSEGIAELRRADAHAAAGDFDAARAAYDSAAAMLPQIGDWIQLFAASAGAGAGDTVDVRTRLADVDSGLVRQWAWRTTVRAHRNAGDIPGAIGHAVAAAGWLSTTGRRAAAWTEAGKLRLEQADTMGARTALLTALEEADASPAGVDAAQMLSDLPGLTADQKLRIGRTYLQQGNLSRGVAGLRAYLDAGRGSPAERDQIRYEIANALFGGADYAAAARTLLEYADGAADRTLASDALYTAARAQYRDGREPVARATLERIMEQYADQPAAARAAFLSADLDHDAVELDRATEHYRRAVRFSPASAEADLSRMRLGGMHFAAGRFDDALREFEAFRGAVQSAGRASQQAAYWTARTLDRLGRAAETRVLLRTVRAADPLSYYGGLAGAELGLGFSLDDLHLEPAPPPNERLDVEVGRALARVDLLREIGWEEAGSFEMERVRTHFARFDGALYTLAESLNERGFTTAGILLGREIQRREGAWNPRLLRIIYPFPFRSIVVAEARERGVDPFLAAALIRQESMFNPRARSPAGALGLMQVMPRTGQTIARRLGIAGFQPDMLTRPELNVTVGMAYLADQLRSYGGRLDLVLAAYNAGPSRVTRWRAFPEAADHVLFPERIPFEETRDYVRVVQNNMRIYSALYHMAPVDGQD